MHHQVNALRDTSIIMISILSYRLLVNWLAVGDGEHALTTTRLDCIHLGSVDVTSLRFTWLLSSSIWAPNKTCRNPKTPSNPTEQHCEFGLITFRTNFMHNDTLHIMIVTPSSGRIVSISSDSQQPGRLMPHVVSDERVSSDVSSTHGHSWDGRPSTSGCCS